MVFWKDQFFIPFESLFFSFHFPQYEEDFFPQLTIPQMGLKTAG